MSTKVPLRPMTMTSQMFVCQNSPAIPDISASDAGLATYIVKLSLAHEDCVAQLETVRNHLEINGVHITEIAHPQASRKVSSVFDLF